MKLINGKRIADELLSELKKRIQHNREIRPCLAVILVGSNPASELYVNIKEKRAKEIGVNFKKINILEQVSDEEIIKVVRSLNQDQAIHGIMLQLPLPRHNSADKIIKEINLIKDIDGLKSESPYVSPFVLAIWQSLQSTHQKLANQKILALVNSRLFGEKLKSFFASQDLIVEYLVKPKDLSLISQADILITALGEPKLIKSSMVKQGVILIDGGVGKKDNQLSGDVDQQNVQDKAAWLTPVPGGVGPLTVFFLLNNLYLATN